MAAGIPLSRRPWLVSWANFLEQREFQLRSGENWVPEAATCKFRHLPDVDKVYDVSFPKGCFVACCGASHGWLVLVNDLSNLVLFNPFTSDMIQLPPITDFESVKAVYDSGGNLEHYLFARGKKVYQTNYLGVWYYQKAMLSCSPSNGGDYTAMIIHSDADWLSFIRAGESKWRSASISDKTDRYCDCAYHNGRFYSMTVHGRVDKWDLDAQDGPTKEAIIDRRHHYAPVLTRHLVSTPWGDLLQVCVIYTKLKSRYPDNVKFQIRKVDLEGCRSISRKDFGDHAIFIGLNHSACLPTENLPGVRPCFIYFSAPWMSSTIEHFWRIPDWGGVRAYDSNTRTFKRVFPFGGMRDSLSLVYPSEVWVTPNI